MLGKKPKEGDYPAAEKQMVQRAIGMYSARILTEIAFPNEEIAVAWAHKDWREECTKHGQAYLSADDDRVHTLVSFYNSCPGRY